MIAPIVVAVADRRWRKAAVAHGPAFETLALPSLERQQDDPVGRFENEGGRVLPPTGPS